MCKIYIYTHTHTHTKKMPPQKGEKTKCHNINFIGERKKKKKKWQRKLSELLNKYCKSAGLEKQSNRHLLSRFYREVSYEKLC